MPHYFHDKLPLLDVPYSLWGNLLNYLGMLRYITNEELEQALQEFGMLEGRDIKEILSEVDSDNVSLHFQLDIFSLPAFTSAARNHYGSNVSLFRMDESTMMSSWQWWEKETPKFRRRRGATLSYDKSNSHSEQMTDDAHYFSSAHSGVERLRKTMNVKMIGVTDRRLCTDMCLNHGIRDKVCIVRWVKGWLKKKKEIRVGRFGWWKVESALYKFSFVTLCFSFPRHCKTVHNVVVSAMFLSSSISFLSCHITWPFIYTFKLYETTRTPLICRVLGDVCSCSSISSSPPGRGSGWSVESGILSVLGDQGALDITHSLGQIINFQKECKCDIHKFVMIGYSLPAVLLYTLNSDRATSIVNDTIGLSQPSPISPMCKQLIEECLRPTFLCFSRHGMGFGP